MWKSHTYQISVTPCSCCNLSSKGTAIAVAFVNILISIAIGAYACFVFSNIDVMYTMMTYLFDSYDFDLNGISAVHAFLFFFAIMHISNNFMLIFAAKMEWKLLCVIYLTLTIMEGALSSIFFIMTSVLVHLLLGLIWLIILIILAFNIFTILQLIKDLARFHKTGEAIPGMRLVNGKKPHRSMRITGTVVVSSERPSGPEQLLEQSLKYVPYEPAGIFGHRPSDGNNNDVNDRPQPQLVEIKHYPNIDNLNRPVVAFINRNRNMHSSSTPRPIYIEI